LNCDGGIGWGRADGSCSCGLVPMVSKLNWGVKDLENKVVGG
jgi:hypothetical protein